jgi:hypothetical protein
MTEPYWSDGTTSLYLGKVEHVLPTLPDASVDAIVTDPPYELGFMGKTWDASGVAYDPAMWAECLRILKPGGHLVAFGGTRTYHRMVCAIEDAGFEIRDSMHWIYGQGFPKSMDVSKAIDKAAGAEREVVGPRMRLGDKKPYPHNSEDHDGAVFGERGARIATAPTTEDAQRWEGWGTALKPAHEPIVLARKPVAGTVAANVVEHGTGALNIDATRVGNDTSRGDRYRGKAPGGGHGPVDVGGLREHPWEVPVGRWPSNVVLTHSATCADACAADCPVAELDQQSEGKRAAKPSKTGSSGGPGGSVYGGGKGLPRDYVPVSRDDSGGASRFFPVFRYEAKAPASERPRLADGTAHSTVKPLTLMRWLVRLVTPPGGTVLDPFAGSGTTGEACAIEGLQSLLIEQAPAHAELIKTRLNKPMQAVLGFEEPA